MRRIVGTALAAALAGLTGASAPAQAQDQETRQIQCRSQIGQRQSCDTGGEVLNAGITNLSGETPCILGYTWGFEENGIWVGNGCAASFAVTVVTEQQKRQATPDEMRERLRSLRKTVRSLRTDLQQEREERQRIEGELTDAQAALTEIGEAKAARADRQPDWMVRAIAACSRKATREIEKKGGDKARSAEILSARPTDGAWLVVGRAVGDFGGQREPSYFRCWVDRGKVQSFDNAI